MDENTQLTPKQERFCMEYLTDLNATKAAARAGYSDHTANEQGARLLANVSIQERIAELQEKQAQRLQINQDRIVQELSALAFSRLSNYVAIVKKPMGICDDPDKDNMPGTLIKASDEWTDDMKAAVVNIKNAGDGKIEIKLGDKIKALELLGKHIGMFSKKEIAITKEIDESRIEEAYQRGKKDGNREFFSVLSLEELKRLAEADVIDDEEENQVENS